MEFIRDFKFSGMGIGYLCQRSWLTATMTGVKGNIALVRWGRIGIDHENKRIGT